MKDAVLMAAQLMAISARTAPKAGGKDNIKIRIVEGEELKKLHRKCTLTVKKRGK